MRDVPPPVQSLSPWQFDADPHDVLQLRLRLLGNLTGELDLHPDNVVLLLQLLPPQHLRLLLLPPLQLRLLPQPLLPLLVPPEGLGVLGLLLVPDLPVQVPPGIKLW